MESFIYNILGRYRMLMMILLLVLGMGMNTTMVMTKESNPEIKIPKYMVTITNRGTSKEDILRMIAKPIEREGSAINGLKRMTSNSRDGSASILFEFYTGVDKQISRNDIREALSKARVDFPARTEEPEIKNILVEGSELIRIVMTATTDREHLYQIGRALKSKILGVKGVYSTYLNGVRDEITSIVIDPQKLENYQLSVPYISGIIGMQNALVPGGTQSNTVGSVNIKIPSLLDNVSDIANIPLRVSKDGTTVYIKDVASVTRDYRQGNALETINEHPSISIKVYRSPGSDIYVTTEKVKKIVRKFQKERYPEMQYKFVKEEKVTTQSQLTTLKNNLVLTILLVAGVLALTLGFRSALVVVVIIPATLFAGVTALYMFGTSLNVVSLFALALSIGLLVDASIILVEYAEIQMGKGIDLEEAYKIAASRMYIPLISSTATTLLAFIPLMFWPSMAGQFIRHLPITLLAVLISSLFMAIFILPGLAIFLHKIKPARVKTPAEIQEIQKQKMESKLNTTYRSMIDTALNHPKRIIWLSFVSLIISMKLFGYSNLGMVFMPFVDSGYIKVMVDSKEPIAQEYKRQRLAKIGSEIYKNNGGNDNIKSVLTTTGPAGDKSVGEILLELQDWQIRPVSTDIARDIRHYFANNPPVGYDTVVVATKNTGMPVTYQIVAKVKGDNLVEIEKANNLILNYLKDRDVVSKAVNKEETVDKGIEIHIKRDKLQEYHLSASDLGKYIRLVTDSGTKISKYNPRTNDNDVNIAVKFPDKWKKVDMIGNIPVAVNAYENGHSVVKYIPMSNFVDITYHKAHQTIVRENKDYIRTINVALKGGVNADHEIDKMIEFYKKNTVPGVELAFSGEREEQQSSAAFLPKAFGVALFMMAVVLVTQYNSIYYMFVTLSAVFLSITGALLGLMMVSIPYSMILSSFAVFALAGIVVNNNILLIDTFKEKYETMPLRDAIIEAATDRLRPILLTVITSSIGMFPVVLKISIDFIEASVSMGSPMSGFWQNLSSIIAIGILFATALTLIVTPCLIYIWERFLARNKNNTAIAE